ncbi:MAG TPA: hypothetical protein VHW26_07940, partial [Solirubrobacteraceae bacterium]|nr:hypothetical protein [Solirubrobacteraceae bacterium]
MSAVFGVLHPTGRRVAAEDLRRMGDALSMWGAAGDGMWREDSIGLGRIADRGAAAEFARRGSVVEAGARGVVLVADVRLADRADLIGQLGLDEVDARVLDDQQLVLRAYLRWGEDCVQRLLGAFAFALWDGRRRRLICARDHIGLRS